MAGFITWLRSPANNVITIHQTISARTKRSINAAVYENDIWELAIVGIKPPPYIRASYIKFHKINPEWLCRLAKKFIRYQSATKAYYTLQVH